MRALIVFLIPVFFLLIHGLSSSTTAGNSRTNRRDSQEKKNNIFEPYNHYNSYHGDESDNYILKNYDNYEDNEYFGGGGKSSYSDKPRARVTRDTTAESQEEADYDEAKAKQKLSDDLKRKMLLDEELHSKSHNKMEKDKKTDDDLHFPDGYSVFEIPKDPFGSPLPLFIHVNVKSILDVDELNEVIKLDLEFKVMWTDFKIFYHNNRSIDPSTYNYNVPIIDKLSPEEVKQKRKVLNNPLILEKIWKPNLFIENLLAVRQPAVMARPLTIKFIPELGWFEYITRISVKLDCEMSFYHYPADTQFCDFSIRGFSYNKERLNLNWYHNGAYLDDLELPSFDVQIKTVSESEWAKKSEPDEVFEVLTFRIAARRRLSYHLVQTYLASTFYIIITCLCFLLPSKMVEARIGISMTTLLTLTAMFASVRESTPIVSYVKAIDIWMVGCIFFVFLTLAQFTFHIWLKNIKDEFIEKERRKADLKRGQVNYGRSIESFEIEDEDPKQNKNLHAPEAFSEIMSRKFLVYDKLANFIDAYSFALFICIFVFCTALYWTWLLTAADYFNWAVNETLNNLEPHQ